MDAKLWEDLKSELYIADINQALLDQSVIFVKYAYAYLQAVKEAQEAAWEVKKSYAVMQESIRRKMSEDSSLGKITEARLEALTLQSPAYMAAQEAYLKAAEKEMEYKLVMQAIQMRKDMLITLSANQREEAYSGIVRQTTLPTNQMSEGIDSLRQKLQGGTF
jgi:hypothetical protein